MLVHKGKTFEMYYYPFMRLVTVVKRWNGQAVIYRYRVSDGYRLRLIGVRVL